MPAGAMYNGTSLKIIAKSVVAVANVRIIEFVHIEHTQKYDPEHVNSDVSSGWTVSILALLRIDTVHPRPSSGWTHVHPRPPQDGHMSILRTASLCMAGSRGSTHAAPGNTT